MIVPSIDLIGGQAVQLVGGEALAREMMAEVLAVAAADGHPMSDDMIDKNIAGTRKMPAYRNSMALDYLADRPMDCPARVQGAVGAESERSGGALEHGRVARTSAT